MLKRLLLLVVVCIVPLAASAHHHDGHTAAEPTVCSGNQVDCAPVVMAATDANGNLWRLYPTDDGLFVQQRLATHEFAQPLQVTDEKVLLGNEQRPQLAFGPKGQIYVAWSVPKQAHWTCDTRFAASSDGRSFSAPVTINRDSQQITHCFPVMKTNDKGDIFIAWLDRRNHQAAKQAGKEYQGMALTYSWSADGGKHFAAKDITLEDQTCECCRLAMTLADNLPVLAFRKIYPGMERDHALVRLSSLDTFEPAERVTFQRWQLNGCPEQGPALLQEGERLHFVWFDQGQLYYKQSVGGKWTAPQAFGQKGGEHPDLLAADGVLYRVWRQYAKGAMRVFVQMSQDQGVSWSEDMPLAATENGSDYPYLVQDKLGVWVTWKTDAEGHLLLPIGD